MDNKNTQRVYLVIGIILILIIIAIFNRNKNIADQLSANKQTSQKDEIAKQLDSIDFDAVKANADDLTEAVDEGEEIVSKSKTVENSDRKKSVKTKNSLFKVQKGFSLPGPATFTVSDEGSKDRDNQLGSIDDEQASEYELEVEALKRKPREEEKNIVQIDRNDFAKSKITALPNPTFELADFKLNVLLDYEQYGDFKDVGTPQYRYVIKKRQEIREDIGAGIYPNQGGVRRESSYKDYKAQGALDGHHWRVLDSQDKLLAFYAWADANEDPGVKTFFTGKVLEESGHIIPAIKAYYAALVHFPRSVGWAADQSFVWYIGPAAIENIERLCEEYPELELQLVGANVNIENGFDTDLSNDVIAVDPGKLVRSP